MLTTAFFSDAFKLSEVIPLFKKGDYSFFCKLETHLVIANNIKNFQTSHSRPNVWLMPLASQYLLLVLYNVQAYIKMLFRVTC